MVPSRFRSAGCRILESMTADRSRALPPLPAQAAFFQEALPLMSDPAAYQITRTLPIKDVDDDVVARGSRSYRQRLLRSCSSSSLQMRRVGSSAVCRMPPTVSQKLLATVEADMVALTSVGNTFNIRHHETGKYPITVEAFDYFFVRMSNVIIVLLRQSDRLD